VINRLRVLRVPADAFGICASIRRFASLKVLLRIRSTARIMVASVKAASAGCELSHHAIVFVLKDVTVIHEGCLRGETALMLSFRSKVQNAKPPSVD
jgi:hypothetical protein